MFSSWFGRGRRRYNGDVSALLPALGVDLDEAGVMKVLDVLDVAWSKRFTVYEAALLVGYSMVGGYTSRGYVHRAATMLRDKVRPVQDDWLKKGIVRLEVVRAWHGAAEERVRAARNKAVWPAGASVGIGRLAPSPEPPAFEITTPGVFLLPDVMARDASRVFRLPNGVVALLVPDVPAYFDPDHMRGVPPVNFPLVLVLHVPEADRFYTVAVERPHGGKPYLVEYRSIEEKRTVEGIPEPISEERFLGRALQMACQHLQLPMQWEEAMLRRSERPSEAGSSLPSSRV